MEPSLPALLKNVETTANAVDLKQQALDAAMSDIMAARAKLDSQEHAARAAYSDAVTAFDAAQAALNEKLGSIVRVRTG